MLFGKLFKDLSDEELMDKASGGSERALEEIYQRYSQPLLRYFYRMLWQDKNKAEDFLHDVFIKVLQKPSQFDSSRKFSTWIYSIAHNFCKNEYRKQAFKNSVHANLKGNEFSNESVTNQLDQQSFQTALEEVLKEEDEEARTIFTLRYELEKSIAEISEIINYPEGTIKSRLFYLKKRLANKLNQYKVVLEK